MYLYVLFTRTGQEEKVVKLFKTLLDTNIYNTFIPKVTNIIKTSKIMKKELKPMFPGYVFIESEMSSTKLFLEVRRIIYSSRDIFRFLYYDDDVSNITMKDHERIMLLSLCNDNYCIEESSGIIVGTRIFIKEGPLMGKESIIKRIDRHKRKAIIDLECMGVLSQVHVGLEIVEKI